METLYLVLTLIFVPLSLIGALYFYVHVRMKLLHRNAQKQETKDIHAAFDSRKPYVKQTFWIDKQIYVVASRTEQENFAKIYRIKKQYHSLKRFF